MKTIDVAAIAIVAVLLYLRWDDLVSWAFGV